MAVVFQTFFKQVKEDVLVFISRKQHAAAAALRSNDDGTTTTAARRRGDEQNAKVTKKKSFVDAEKKTRTSGLRAIFFGKSFASNDETSVAASVALLLSIILSA